MNPLNQLVLLKQQIYTEIISVWKIGNQLLEITQKSQGKYLIYELTEEELKEWDNYSHFSGGLSNGSANVGEESRILTGEWGQHNETGK